MEFDVHGMSMRLLSLEANLNSVTGNLLALEDRIKELEEWKRDLNALLVDTHEGEDC